MAVDYNIVTLSGTIAGGEIWSTTCAYLSNFGTGPLTTFDDLQTWAEAIAALDDSLYANLTGALSTAATIDTVRTAYIDTAGLTAQAAEAPISPVWTGLAAADKPAQCSFVLSLLTGRPGRSYRGRMYWPALRAVLASGAVTVAPVTAQGLANNAAALLTDIGGAAGSGPLLMPAVASQTKGVVTMVTSIKVGTVIDTQRRRRNSLQEAYSSAVVPPAA